MHVHSQIQLEAQARALAACYGLLLRKALERRQAQMAQETAVEPDAGTATDHADAPADSGTAGTVAQRTRPS